MAFFQNSKHNISFFLAFVITKTFFVGNTCCGKDLNLVNNKCLNLQLTVCVCVRVYIYIHTRYKSPRVMDLLVLHLDAKVYPINHRARPPPLHPHLPCTPCPLPLCACLPRAPHACLLLTCSTFPPCPARSCRLSCMPCAPTVCTY
jgi:hypothetical protein